MADKQTLMLLSTQVEERRKLVNNDLGLGAKDHLAYVSAVGEIAGYMRVQRMISDLMTASNKEEEDFESTPTDSVVKIDSKRRGK
tara:strand:- start:9 stop:263 length:255 start_codon:yes stop_codon:yes gene_type:complete